MRSPNLRFGMIFLAIFLMWSNVLFGQSILPGNPYTECIGKLKDTLCGLPGIGDICSAGDYTSSFAQCIVNDPNPIVCLARLHNNECRGLNDPGKVELCEKAISWAKDIKSCVDGGLALPGCMDVICRSAPPPFGQICSTANNGTQALLACFDGLTKEIDNFYECSQKADSDPQVCQACANQAFGKTQRAMLSGPFDGCDQDFRQRYMESCDKECTSQVMQSSRGQCRAAGQTGGTLTGGLERCCRKCVTECQREVPPCNRNNNNNNNRKLPPPVGR